MQRNTTDTTKMNQNPVKGSNYLVVNNYKKYITIKNAINVKTNSTGHRCRPMLNS